MRLDKENFSQAWNNAIKYVRSRQDREWAYYAPVNLLLTTLLWEKNSMYPIQFESLQKMLIILYSVYDR